MACARFHLYIYDMLRDFRVLIPHEMRDQMFGLAHDGRVGKVMMTSRLRSTL